MRSGQCTAVHEALKVAVCVGECSCSALFEQTGLRRVFSLVNRFYTKGGAKCCYIYIVIKRHFAPPFVFEQTV